MKQKQRVDLLSREVQKTCETLQGLCNEILYDQDPDSIENNRSGVDNISEILLFQVSKKVNEHLDRTRFMLNAYEEYSEMFDRTFNPAVMNNLRDNLPSTFSKKRMSGE